MSVEQKRQLIDPGHPQVSLRRQWALLGLAHASLYYQPVRESAENEHRMRLLDTQDTATPFYGSRRMTAWLRSQGYAVNRKRVTRLMQQMGLEALYTKPQLSQAAEGHAMYPYLLRGVKIERVNHVWSTDITSIRLQQGFIYLVAVIDWFSRYVLSWAVSITLDGTFCLEALHSSHRQPPVKLWALPGARVAPRREERQRQAQPFHESEGHTGGHPPTAVSTSEALPCLILKRLSRTATPAAPDQNAV